MAETGLRGAFAELAQAGRRQLLDLCLPARHDLVVERQRRRTMDGRARATAGVVAALTAGWIVVDAMTFPAEVWRALASERLLTSLALALMSIPRLHNRRGPLVETRALGILLVIFGFFLAASYTLTAAQASTDFLAAVSAYVHLPFLIAAGIGLFPVLGLEGLVLTGVAVGATTLSANAMGPGDGHRMYDAGSLWLLTTICGVATLGGMLQLRSLVTVTRQSCRDGLTGLLRRSVGEELLAVQFAAAERAGQPLSIMFLDLDEFKAINDASGHEAGDAALTAAAAAMHAGVRRQDTVVRWGGEEFLVILPNTGTRAACTVAERIGRRGLGQRPDGRPLTASVGLAERRADGAGVWSNLVGVADERTFAAKRAGRNRIIPVDGDAKAFTAAAPALEPGCRDGARTAGRPAVAS